MTEKDGAYARIYEVVLTADETNDKVTVTALNFYRGRHKLTDADGISIPFSGGGYLANCEIELGGVFPAPSVIRLKSTFTAL